MSKKSIVNSFVICLLVLTIMPIPWKTLALTNQEQAQAIIAQINQLQAQLNALKAQQAQQGQNGQQTTTTGAQWCYTFNNNLRFDAANTEVTSLQTALSKEGIFINTTGVFDQTTFLAVKTFQEKYRAEILTPSSLTTGTGFVGMATRAKLNKLYGCQTGFGSGQITTCRPNWTCSQWSICLNGQQTQSCTDSNTCGVTTNKPVTARTCNVVPAVDIMANDSSGPVNVFLASGNGATVKDGSIDFNTNINLQWVSVNATSCQASEYGGFGSSYGSSAVPTAFAGWLAPRGSITVPLTGSVKVTTNSINKISNTYRISCLSLTSGSQISDSVTVNLFYTTNTTCIPNWSCSSYTTCQSSQQTRTCTDTNNCGFIVNQPVLKQSCTCTPNWSCSGFGACTSGRQTQTCTDLNSCNSTTNKPALSQTCTTS